MSDVDELIARLALQAHPEGGWYRETWRGPEGHERRAIATAILFLLKGDERSHWHRIDAQEIWFWQAGDPLLLQTSAYDGQGAQRTILGPGVAEGQSLQGFVEPHRWQAAKPLNGDAGYSLASCVVAPGFEFASFELAPPDWQPG